MIYLDDFRLQNLKNVEHLLLFYNT